MIDIHTGGDDDASPIRIFHNFIRHVLLPVEMCSIALEDDDDDFIVLFDEEAFLTASRPTSSISTGYDVVIDERFLKQLLRSQCFSEHLLDLHVRNT